MTSLSTVRPDWEAVPAPVRDYIEKRLEAKVVNAQTVSGGYTEGMACRLELDDGRRVFVKGVPAGHALEGVYTTETYLTAALPEGPFPHLLWSSLSSDGVGWVLLCTEDIDGGHVDLSPGSPDVADLVATLGHLVGVLSPCPLPDAPQVVDLMGRALACWQELEEEMPSDLDPLMVENLPRLIAIERDWEKHAVGDTLVHLDTRPDNILKRPSGPVLIDWSCSRQGAPWLEGVFLVPHLVLAGHAPERAEAVVAPLLRDVPKEAVTSLVVALAGHWEACSRADPMPGLPHLRALQKRTAQAAWEWAKSRLDLS
ncbi:phosphotransferase [Streptomyces lydicus]|uniref:phosphotransferase n=1 Tax=Streptomyces lydicus TaxID=47763 RepID=UPI003792E391